MASTVFAALSIADPAWFLPAALIAFAAAALLWFGYRRVRMASAVRVSAISLKLLGVAFLAVCLVEPLWSGVRARPGANLFAVVVDTSASLNVRDAGSDTSRADVVRRLVGNPESGWQARLAQDFDVRRYTFDGRLRQTGAHDDLEFDGTSTTLDAALSAIRTRYHDRPLAGVLVITDGNATDVKQRFEASGVMQSRPVYPVVVGTADGLKDVSIENVAVSQAAFEDAPVTVRADVALLGYSDAKSDVRLTAQIVDHEDGRVVATESVDVGPHERTGVFRFQLRPAKPGLSFYSLRTAIDGNWEQFESSDVSDEATLENNVRLFQVDRGSRPRRILYVSGRPNWEFKFLNRAVVDDPQIELAALIRIGKREAKFEFRGRDEESSNALFRGFDKDEEETEQYDEPVLVRLNMRSPHELRAGFPKSEKDLYTFDAVVLDDVEAAFFSQDQKELLQRFVSRRGGGLLMLGGQESFGKGGWRRTPVGDMLPVYLDRPPTKRLAVRSHDNHGAGAESSKPVLHRLALTREGWLKPWMRLRTTEADERVRFESMPSFQTLNRVGGVKPGAQVLAEAKDETGAKSPALAAQRYGRGRTAALLTGDLWRWRLRRADAANDDFSKSWRQTLRWLVSDVPERVEVAVEPAPADGADAVAVQVRVRDEEHKPLENGSVRIAITTPDGETVKIDAEASTKEPGLYEAAYLPRATGVYRTSVVVGDETGKAVCEAASGWTTQPAAREFRRVAPNRALMEQIASASGGELVEPSDLDSFVRTLSTRRAPVTEEWSYPLWHQSWVFLLAVACFVGEWGLRRWKGLP